MKKPGLRFAPSGLQASHFSPGNGLACFTQSANRASSSFILVNVEVTHLPVLGRAGRERDEATYRERR